jgi:hypothetical protein
LEPGKASELEKLTAWATEMVTDSALVTGWVVELARE